MIFKGNARKGPTELALHLSNEIENEKVTVLDIRGAASNDLYGAFREWDVIADQSNARKPLYSLSINPDPEQRDWTDEEWMKAINKAEEKLGLNNQPRAIVFHEKIGDSDGELRKHCHVVWSRVNGKTLKAIPTSHDRYKLKSCAKELTKEFDLELREGRRNDQSYDLAKSKAKNRDPQTQQQRKETITKLWIEHSDPKVFAVAMSQHGYVIAAGEKRAFVIVDREGQVHALARQIEGVRTKAVKERLGDPAQFPPVEQAQEEQNIRLQQNEKIIKPKQKRIDLTLEEKRMRKYRRMAQRADALEKARRLKFDNDMKEMKARHKLELKRFLRKQRFEETRILTKRERNKPKGALRMLSTFVGYDMLMNWKYQQQDRMRSTENIKVNKKLRSAQDVELERLQLLRIYKLFSKATEHQDLEIADRLYKKSFTLSGYNYRI